MANYSRRTTRILCINCNICVNTLRRYTILQQNTRVSSMMEDEVTDDDVICEACWELAMNAVNYNLQQNIASRDEQQASSSQRGHTNITSFDRVCHTCWLRVKRQALRQNRLGESRPAEEVLQPNEEQEQPLENPQIPVSIETANTNPSEIILPDYRRAANTANHCVCGRAAGGGPACGAPPPPGWRATAPPPCLPPNTKTSTL
ncbi:hypothetical protein ACJJTC_001115 [Scirpophaga incertulas]